MRLLIALIIVLCVIFIWYNLQFTKIAAPKRNWIVSAGYENSTDAAALLDNVNVTVIKFLHYLRDKYHIDRPDDLERGHTHNEKIRKIIDALLDNYNPDTVREHRPLAGETSFTRDKGVSMYLCLRQKDNPNKLVDRDILLFVVLHEISHIAAYYTWDHTPEFWQVFKFLLEEAVVAGIYTPVDYSKAPVMYCGLEIYHNPLFDNSIISVAKLNL